MADSTGVEMTPDIDLDALTVLEQSIPPAPWRVAPTLPSPSVRTDGGTELVYATWRDSGPAVLKFIAALRNNWPALLSALTATRAELETAKREIFTLTNSEAAEIAFAVTERNAAHAEADMWQRQVEALTKSAGEYMKVRDAEADKMRAELAEARLTIAARDAALKASDETHHIAQQIVAATLGVAPAAAPQPICGDATFGEVCAKPAGHVEAGDTWHERADQLAAAPQPDDERWTWAVSCPGCGQAKGHPCIGALGGDGAVHPERRGRAVAFGYGLNAAAGAGDGEQDACTRCGGLDGTHLHRDCPNARRDALKARHDAHMAKYAVKGDGVQDTATAPRTYLDMPVVKCHLVRRDVSHMAHVFDDGTSKVVCNGLLPHSVPLDAPASVQGAADGEAQA